MLARQTLLLAGRAYQTGGITNGSARVRKLKAKGVRRADYRHAVFGRAGQPCYVCGSDIERVEVSSRRLYFCPTCQRPVE